MAKSLQAAETTAFVDENGHLTGMEPLQGLTPGAVRVIVLRETGAAEQEDYDASELTPEAWAHNLAANPAFAFLHDPAEDIYTREDGDTVGS